MVKNNTIGENKKGSFNTELILAVFAIVLFFVVSYLSYSMTTSAKDQYYKMAPNLTYELPSVFIHTYLMLPVSKEDKKSIGLDENTIFFVKDLLYLDTDKSTEMAERYRKEYVDKYSGTEDSPVYTYQMFSENIINNVDNMLCISYEKSPSRNLDSDIRQNNYFYHLKTSQNRYAYVIFDCS